MREIRKPLEKRIRALCDFSLNTQIEDRSFINGEVADVKFISEQQFNSLLKFKKFEEVDVTVPVECVIPIIEKPLVIENKEEFVLEDNLKNKVDELVFRE